MCKIHTMFNETLQNMYQEISSQESEYKSLENWGRDLQEKANNENDKKILSQKGEMPCIVCDCSTLIYKMRSVNCVNVSSLFLFLQCLSSSSVFTL